MLTLLLACLHKGNYSLRLWQPPKPTFKHSCLCLLATPRNAVLSCCYTLKVQAINGSRAKIPCCLWWVALDIASISFKSLNRELMSGTWRQYPTLWIKGHNLYTLTFVETCPSIWLYLAHVYSSPKTKTSFVSRALPWIARDFPGHKATCSATVSILNETRLICPPNSSQSANGSTNGDVPPLPTDVWC